MSSRRFITGRSLALALAGGLTAGSLPALADSGLSPAEETAIATVIAGAAGDAGQCPSAGSLSILARAEPEHVAAIAEFTAKRLRAQDDVTAGKAETGRGSGGDGSSEAGREEAGDADPHCSCAAQLSATLAEASPESAGEVRGAFDDSFPECGKKVTAAIEDSLGGSAAGPGIPLDRRPDIPLYGPYGDPSVKCGPACSTAEPPPAHDASQTAL